MRTLYTLHNLLPHKVDHSNCHNLWLLAIASYIDSPLTGIKNIQMVVISIACTNWEVGAAAGSPFQKIP